MAILDVDGGRIAYDELGRGTSGETIVFLHACGLNRLMWGPQMDALRGTHHVLAPDMRGHGASDIPKGVISIERMADDVQALVLALDLAPVILVGHSMGGSVAVEYARKYPGFARALVLVSGNADPGSSESKADRRALIDAIAAGGSAAAAAAMMPALLSDEALEKRPDLALEVRRMIETTSAQGIVGALAGLDAHGAAVRADVAVDAPTLVVAGRESASSVATARALAAASRKARLALVEDAGCLANAENASAFTAELVEFVALVATDTENVPTLDAGAASRWAAVDSLVAHPAA